MKKTLLEGPQELAVSLSAAKTNLRIDGDHLDDVIALWIEGIVSELEHDIGQRLMRQTWRVTLDAFPAARMWGSADVCTTVIALPHPVLKVKTVTYVDDDGEQQVLPEAAYEISTSELSTVLVPATRTVWPSAAVRRDGVKVEVECGFGDTPEDVPACMRLYILARLIEQFDPSSKPAKDSVQSVYLARLLDGCRTYQ